MDRDFSDSLEVISNLLYLIRMTLHDPARATAYVNLAEQRVRTIELKMRLDDMLTRSSAVQDKSCESGNTVSIGCAPALMVEQEQPASLQQRLWHHL